MEKRRRIVVFGSVAAMVLGLAILIPRFAVANDPAMQGADSLELSERSSHLEQTMREKKTYGQLGKKLVEGKVLSIKLIGDSISAGMGAQNFKVPLEGQVIVQDGKKVYREASFDSKSWANSFRAYVERQSFGKINFFNAGVSGKTAKWTLDRADLLLSPNEDVVFVMIGTNDRLIGSLQQYEQTVRQLLHVVDARSELMIVMAPPPSVNTIADYKFAPEDINRVLKQISHENDYIFISHFEGINDYLANHPEVRYEDLMETNSPHPTSKGYAVMWETIQRTLQLDS